MIETPFVTETEAQSAAVIRLVIPKDQIQVVMGPGIQEVLAAVAAQGIGPAGPWYTYHRRLDPDVWDFEIGVPVSGEVRAVGRVEAGGLSAARVARTVYHGPYEGLAEGWSELTAWIAAAGHESAPDSWEYYTVGPETSSDPALWRTELNRRLTGG
jgi:effector-binding domain-containing protein